MVMLMLLRLYKNHVITTFLTMDKFDVIAQACGIVGMIIIVLSFQVKDNKKFFILQGLGSSFFVINFLMIGAIAGALFNLANFVRGMLFSRNAEKLWKLIVTEVLYIGCYIFSVISVWGDNFQIFLSALPFVALFFMSICMWKGNGKHIRYSQILYMSPAWIVHNIFNFSLGGLICETFNMISSGVALIRQKKGM